jgi:hypothetical protein
MSRNDDWNDKDIVSAFFKMVYTLGLWIFWLMFTIYWGIARDWAFFDHSGVPIWQHIVFFVWLTGTLPLIIWVTRTKIWKL